MRWYQFNEQRKRVMIVMLLRLLPSIVVLMMPIRYIKPILLVKYDSKSRRRNPNPSNAGSVTGQNHILVGERMRSHYIAGLKQILVFTKLKKTSRLYGYILPNRCYHGIIVRLGSFWGACWIKTRPTRWSGKRREFKNNSPSNWQMINA